MSKAEKTRRAEDVLLKMGLKECADNIIGSELKKGISGGEKRRVSIAIQVLTDPKLLLLDEPTSGLDAFTATSILDVLATLASEGRNIIMTVSLVSHYKFQEADVACQIHQARSDIFTTFDNILLLARGGAQVYGGPGSEMLAHFASLGHHCPTTSNPSDFVLDAITVDLQEEQREAVSRERVQRIIQTWAEKQRSRSGLHRAESKIASPAQLQSLKREMSPFSVTFPIVTYRSILQIFRNWDMLLARTTQVISIGAIFALFFAPLQKNYEAVGTSTIFSSSNILTMIISDPKQRGHRPRGRSYILRRHVAVSRCLSISSVPLLPRAYRPLLRSRHLPPIIHTPRIALHRHI